MVGGVVRNLRIPIGLKLLCAAAIAWLPEACCLGQGDLQTPVMVDRNPAAGLRVRQVAPEYQGTQVYHALYLPSDWQSDKKFPVIVEYTGNQWKFGPGTVKEANLGYGMCGGSGFLWDDALYRKRP